MNDRALNASSLARAAGLTHVAVGNYMKGRVPTYAAAEKLAAVFGVAPDYLLNPARFTAPLKQAAAAAAAVPPNHRQAVFDAVSSALTQSLSQGARTAAPLPLNVIDWQGRALAAEAQLVEISAALTVIKKNIKPPPQS
jgi:transcriptional regulator with XRE-family HTH domain